MTDDLKFSTTTPAQWDAFIGEHPNAHVLQQWAWGDLKAAFGWEAERVALTNSKNEIVAAAQLLFRRLPFRLSTMAYLAMGPLVRQHSSSSGRGLPAANPFEADLWKAIDDVSRKHHAAFLKWEPGIFAGQSSNNTSPISVLSTRYSALPTGFRPSPQTVQPPNTVMIDISGSEDAILARMNQGTRRKIRQSLKNGITYREGTMADVAIFTGMMNTTGERNEFGVHEPAYYQKAYDLFVPQGDAALILAEHE
ncbi:MAG: peptidoglycan bridge formation glycyltransferase FemA/FemB family protein, partial [Chloroflexota bacterium]